VKNADSRTFGIAMAVDAKDLLATRDKIFLLIAMKQGGPSVLRTHVTIKFVDQTRPSRHPRVQHSASFLKASSLILKRDGNFFQVPRPPKNAFIKSPMFSFWYQGSVRAYIPNGNTCVGRAEDDPQSIAGLYCMDRVNRAPRSMIRANAIPASSVCRDAFPFSLSRQIIRENIKNILSSFPFSLPKRSLPT
jgi:hypothetical protein